MKHLKPFKLFELNKVGEYYKDNPKKVLNDAGANRYYKGDNVDSKIYGVSGKTEDYMAKLALQNGISLSSLIPAINAVYDYKSGDKKMIPKAFRKVLMKLTVKPNNIPPVLWRGIVLSVPYELTTDEYAATITPELIASYTKAKCVSWSTSKWEAIKFMMKGKGGDYVPKIKILLKYTNLSYEDVIVDTREIRGLKYPYEMEIILDPNATNFQVEELFTCDKGYEVPNSPFMRWYDKQVNLRSLRKK